MYGIWCRCWSIWRSIVCWQLRLLLRSCCCFCDIWMVWFKIMFLILVVLMMMMYCYFWLWLWLLGSQLVLLCCFFFWVVFFCRGRCWFVFCLFVEVVRRQRRMLVGRWLWWLRLRLSWCLQWCVLISWWRIFLFCIFCLMIVLVLVLEIWGRRCYGRVEFSFVFYVVVQKVGGERQEVGCICCCGLRWFMLVFLMIVLIVVVLVMGIVYVNICCFVCWLYWFCVVRILGVGSFGLVGLILICQVVRLSCLFVKLYLLMFVCVLLSCYLFISMCYCLRVF